MGRDPYKGIAEGRKAEKYESIKSHDCAPHWIRGSLLYKAVTQGKETYNAVARKEEQQ